MKLLKHTNYNHQPIVILKHSGGHSELNHANNNQKISSREFLTAISHELKTPLNAIIGFAEVLSDKELTSEERQDYISEIISAANNMNDLVHDLLDVGQSGSGSFSVDLSKEIDLRDAINRSVKINYNYALRQSIKIEVDLEDDFKVRLDEKRIKQILTNLISNAVKYSSQGSQIKIIAEKKDDFLQIIVADHGFGMTLAQVETAFQKYKTINNPNRGDVDSFGLGLPIVKQLVELMNGKIEMKSEVNKGTEVILRFPYLMQKNHHQQTP